MKAKSSQRSANPITDNLIEVVPRLHAVRGLRVGLIDLAGRLTEMDADATAVLVLADPLITDQRLDDEWRLTERILRPELLQRMTVVVSRGGKLRGYPRDPDPATQLRVERALKTGPDSAGLRLPRTDTYPEILKVLVARHLTGGGPMTADRLAQTVGCNYRTVARTLDRLRPSLGARSDRKIELREFPREEWAGLVALGDRARTTIRFVDTSGQPRSPQSLVTRLEKMGSHDVAVGGVLGAAHYGPKIEFAGSARLDLSVHCPASSLALAFVGRLDPALARSNDPALPAALVLHVVRRRESLFEADTSGGLRSADPAECLLDLHEARLETQARNLFDALEARRKAAL
jgi:hypothetical protein